MNTLFAHQQHRLSILSSVYSHTTLIMLLLVCGLVWGCVEREPIAKKKKGKKPSEPQEILSEDPALEGYAFDKLTPTGKTLFLNARKYMETQKASAYHTFAQPLQCAVNISEVMEMSHLAPRPNAAYSVPGLLKDTKNKGGTLHLLPQTTEDNKQPLIKYLNTHFSGNLPTGTLVAGCTVASCETKEHSEAHIALLGDKDHTGTLMLYHNNWLRPNNTNGRRLPYMVSISSFYDLKRPREWMPTPWIQLKKDKQGHITDITSITPDIDDLDPLNPKYFITLAIPHPIAQELEKGDLLEHHKLLITENPHNDYRKNPPDGERVVCRSNRGLKDMNIRSGVEMDTNTSLLSTFKRYLTHNTPYNSRFEFVIVTKKSPWLAIKFYAINRYFGSTNNKIWIQEDEASCKSLKEWLK